jgi:chemotaxis protein CheZ
MSEAGKKVFTAERYSNRRGFSMVAKVPGASSGDGSSSVGNEEVLMAIEELRQEIAELKNSGISATATPAPVEHEIDEEEEADVRIEIAQMVRSIGKTKSELAAIKHPMADDDRIKAASSELDEIVIGTQTATEDILRSTEHVGELLDEILARHPTDERLYTLTEEAGQELVNIMEACSFQDITGQRVTKVVNTIRYIQDRILSMIGIWGADAFIDLPVPDETPAEEGEALLNGPALSGEGLSQSDIDALFD